MSTERELEELAWSVHSEDCTDPARCDKYGWGTCVPCIKLREKIDKEFQALLRKIKLLEQMAEEPF